MKLLLHLLIVASALISTINGAAVQCEAICEIGLDMDCASAQETLEFQGECCALEEVDGECFMISTKSCQFKAQGANATSCYYDEFGQPVACLPAYTVYFAQSDEPCPESDFVVPQWTNAPSASPQEESLVPTPVSTGSFMTMDTKEGDCYFVERTFTATTHHPFTGCAKSMLTYSYFNGGTRFGEDGLLVDTGMPKIVYNYVTVSVDHDCYDQDTSPDKCTITVDGVGTCNGCSYSNQLITMNDCSNLEPQVFLPGVQSVSFLNDGGAPQSPGASLFFVLAFDEDRCDDFVPSSTTPLGPSSVPSYPGTEEPPSLPPWGETVIKGLLSFEIDSTPERTPTPDEVSQVLVQLGNFYTAELAEAFPGIFYGVMPVSSSRRHLQVYQPLDFDLYFDLELYFTADGSEPTDDEIYEALKSADYTGMCHAMQGCNFAFTLCPANILYLFL